MLFLTDSEECCIKTNKGYVHRKSIIEQVDNGLRIICPWHANYDPKIVSVSYGDSADAKIVERWFAEKIAREIGGQVIPLINVKPLNKKISILERIRGEISNRFSKSWFTSKSIVDLTNFVAAELSKLLPKKFTPTFPIEVYFQDLSGYIEKKGSMPDYPMIPASECERGEIPKCDKCENCDHCDQYDANAQMILGLCRDKGKRIIYHSGFLKDFWIGGVSIVEVVLHEVFHWYQHQIVEAILHSGLYKWQNPMALNWEKNLIDYIEPWEDFEAYKTQPVERTANFFAWYVLEKTKTRCNWSVYEMMDEYLSYIITSVKKTS